MNILMHPTYFPSIATFIAIANADKVTFEVCDNYQKQTYRNRMFIYDANGKLPLTVPVIYSQKNRQLYKNILIASDEYGKIYIGNQYNLLTVVLLFLNFMSTTYIRYLQNNSRI